ncbi:hypothetical protein F5Y17DRAFT_455600 [Xylariaceae sp. FL0594]|nr:hypothetical protein F5Y17DRAFT_455600 [Xylariaceae sp. FL0594]
MVPSIASISSDRTPLELSEEEKLAVVQDVVRLVHDTRAHFILYSHMPYEECLFLECLEIFEQATMLAIDPSIHPFPRYKPVSCYLPLATIFLCRGHTLRKLGRYNEAWKAYHRACSEWKASGCQGAPGDLPYAGECAREAMTDKLASMATAHVVDTFPRDKFRLQPGPCHAPAEVVVYDTSFLDELECSVVVESVESDWEEW